MMKIEVDNMFYRTATKEGGWHSLQTSTAGGYERHIKEGKTRHLYYISGADGMVAICKKEDNNKQFYYVHKDHLGSPHVITDENKEVQARYYYDVWGRRYFVNKENGSELTGQNDLSWMQRGFTGHVREAAILQGEAAEKYRAEPIPQAEYSGEHIKELDLINMSNEVRSRTLFMTGNGRMFDPLLGRFLSPDPYVQSPDRTKNFNRYAYAMNNPLVFEDPTGEFPWVSAGIVLAFTYLKAAHDGADKEDQSNPLKWDWKLSSLFNNKNNQQSPTVIVGVGINSGGEITGHLGYGYGEGFGSDYIVPSISYNSDHGIGFGDASNLGNNKFHYPSIIYDAPYENANAAIKKTRKKYMSYWHGESERSSQTYSHFPSVDHTKIRTGISYEKDQLILTEEDYNIRMQELDLECEYLKNETLRLREINQRWINTGKKIIDVGVISIEVATGIYINSWMMGGFYTTPVPFYYDPTKKFVVPPKEL